MNADIGIVALLKAGNNAGTKNLRVFSNKSPSIHVVPDGQGIAKAQL
jgi:hypothetical protein